MRNKILHSSHILNIIMYDRAGERERDRETETENTTQKRW